MASKVSSCWVQDIYFGIPNVVLNMEMLVSLKFRNEGQTWLTWKLLSTFVHIILPLSKWCFLIGPEKWHFIQIHWWLQQAVICSMVFAKKYPTTQTLEKS